MLAWLWFPSQLPLVPFSGSYPISQHSPASRQLSLASSRHYSASNSGLNCAVPREFIPLPRQVLDRILLFGRRQSQDVFLLRLGLEPLNHII